MLCGPTHTHFVCRQFQLHEQGLNSGKWSHGSTSGPQWNSRQLPCISSFSLPLSEEMINQSQFLGLRLQSPQCGQRCCPARLVLYISAGTQETTCCFSRFPHCGRLAFTLPEGYVGYPLPWGQGDPSSLCPHFVPRNSNGSSLTCFWPQGFFVFCLRINHFPVEFTSGIILGTSVSNVIIQKINTVRTV